MYVIYVIYVNYVMSFTSFTSFTFVFSILQALCEVVGQATFVCLLCSDKMASLASDMYFVICLYIFDQYVVKIARKFM
jgi:hypothetical protein